MLRNANRVVSRTRLSPWQLLPGVLRQNLQYGNRNELRCLSSQPEQVSWTPKDKSQGQRSQNHQRDSRSSKKHKRDNATVHREKQENVKADQIAEETTEHIIQTGNVDSKTRKQKSRPPAAGVMLAGVLDSGKDTAMWRAKAAASRSRRLHIILLQEYLRAEEGGELIAKQLPPTRQRKSALATLHAAGHTKTDMDAYVNILQTKDDEERCRKFLQLPGSKPLFILGYLLRDSSQIHDPVLLSSLIDHFCTNYFRNLSSDAGTSNNTQKSLSTFMAPAEFAELTTSLSSHCFRIEPRLSLKLADLVSQYIETYTTDMHTGQRYHDQCAIFNQGLQLFRPQSQRHLAHGALPNEYLWEGQRKLLAMSSRLEKPLLVDGSGFRAIRDVLSGLPKSRTEIHSILRHAPTWPPYLLPGDGMDEITDPEDNWSRTVGAGMLMQEAGFSKYEVDDALDILQGMGVDGTPTIQQRVAPSASKRAGIWEATIRATRNAQEAWDRFQNPPIPGCKPGPAEYAVMFEKLVLRDIPTNSKDLPGDKLLNFPTLPQANLAEFEKARLRPPSVAQLYDQMRLGGVRPKGKCLQVLVSNAESVDTATQYLCDSTQDSTVIRNLLAAEPEAELLKQCSLSLFGAYVQALLRDSQQSGNNMRRAVRITGMRLDGEESPGASAVWGHILKHLGQRHQALRITATEQLNLLLVINDKIQSCRGMSLATLTQFNKSLRKIVKRQTKAVLNSISEESTGKPHDLAKLYEYSTAQAEISDGTPNTNVEGNATSSLGDLTTQARKRVKADFATLVERERSHQQHLAAYEVTPIERILARQDPVTSNHAIEYMLTLAYLGDYNGMRSLVAWLVDEWSQPGLIQALQEVDEIPTYADFYDILCAYRFFAEPMLGTDAAIPLRAAIASKGLHWAWPEDEAVNAYAEMHDDDTMGMLRDVIEWTKYRQKRNSSNGA